MPVFNSGNSQTDSQFKNVSSRPDLAHNYIYIPLHYQPERTTMPEGNVFNRQFLMVDLLDKSLPQDWHLYDKEHPSQFESELDGERERSGYNYKDLNALSNVELINLGMDPYKLIDNAEAMLTVTGTPGWESVVRGTPVMVFGNPWYRECPGVYHVEKESDIVDALSEIRNGIDITRDETRKFVDILGTIGCRSYQSRNWEDSNRIDRETNIENIVNILSSLVSDNASS